MYIYMRYSVSPLYWDIAQSSQELYVCMYVCMHVCMYVRTYVCIYIHTYIHITYSVSILYCDIAQSSEALHIYTHIRHSASPLYWDIAQSSQESPPHNIGYQYQSYQISLIWRNFQRCTYPYFVPGSTQPKILESCRENRPGRPSCHAAPQLSVFVLVY
jgi:hypothetical protein